MKIRHLPTIATCLAMVCMTLSCTKKIYVPVDRYFIHRDSTRSALHTVDSILMRDSIHIETRGDTVRHTIFRWRYRDRMVRDTLLSIKIDTVSVSTAIPVPAELSTPDRRYLRIGKIAAHGSLIIAIVLAIVSILRLLRNRRPNPS